MVKIAKGFTYVSSRSCLELLSKRRFPFDVSPIRLPSLGQNVPDHRHPSNLCRCSFPIESNPLDCAPVWGRPSFDRFPSRCLKSTSLAIKVRLKMTTMRTGAEEAAWETIGPYANSEPSFWGLETTSVHLNAWKPELVIVTTHRKSIAEERGKAPYARSTREEVRETRRSTRDETRGCAEPPLLYISQPSFPCPPLFPHPPACKSLRYAVSICMQSSWSFIFSLLFCF